MSVAGKNGSRKRRAAVARRYRRPDPWALGPGNVRARRRQATGTATVAENADVLLPASLAVAVRNRANGGGVVPSISTGPVTASGTRATSSFLAR